MKDKYTLVIEITRTLIKACRVRITKKDRIIDYCQTFALSGAASLTTKFAPMPSPNKPDEELSTSATGQSRKEPKIMRPALSFPTIEDLRDIWEKIPKTDHPSIIFSLSRELFLMRFLTLPSHDKKELATMLPFQLAKIVPFPLEEALYDFSPLESTTEFSKIILFLIQEKNIRTLLDFFKRHALTPEVISLSSWGLYLWLAHSQPTAFEDKSTKNVIIDIDISTIDFVVVDKNGLIFSRSFPYENRPQIVEGITHSLAIFNREFNNARLEHCFVTGLNNEDILTQCPLPKIIFINNTQAFNCTDEVISQPDRNFSFASLLGLSLQKNWEQFDFSPQRLKAKRTHHRQRQQFLKIAVLGAELCIIAGILLCKYAFDKYHYLHLLNTQLSALKVEAKGLDTLANRLKILEKEFKKGSRFTEMTSAIVSILPQNTHLTLLDFQENGDLSLKGYTDDISRVFTIVASLTSLNLFHNLTVKYASQLKKESQTLIEFYIAGKFKIK